MDTPDFQDFVNEYTVSGIGPLLYTLVYDIVDKTVKRYPPEIYSPNKLWDEDAISALCNDFTLKKLIESRQLEYHLLAQETKDGLTRSLRRDFRHFLISQRARSEYINLFRRTRKILQNDARFQSLSNDRQPKGMWGLAGWTNKDYFQRLDDVIEAMFAVELPPLVRYRKDSKKISHLLSNDVLGDFLESTFNKANKYISLDLIMDGIRYRLGCLETESISFEDPIWEADTESDMTYTDIIPDSSLFEPELLVESKEIAFDIYERLSDRQRRALVCRLSMPKATLEEIGKYIGASKSTVHGDINLIEQLLSHSQISLEEGEPVLAYLAEMCTGYLNGAGANDGLLGE